MIILSQNKMMLINFDNISGIVIRQNKQDDMWQLQCKANEENKRILGKYKTEERAKEILQNLFEQYMQHNWIIGYDGYKLPEE